MRRTLFLRLLVLLTVPLMTMAIVPAFAGVAPAATTNTYIPFTSQTNDFGQGPVNPLKATLTLDSADRVSQSVPTTGGTLSKTVNGTTYTLTIPQDALLLATTITMTPISAASGLGHSTFVAGVELGPFDVTLWKPVTLTIMPSRTIPVQNQFTWTASDGGYDLHGYPPSPTDPHIVFNLVHFSDDVYSEVAAIPVVDPGQRPATSRSQLEADLQALVKSERDALLNNLPGDPLYTTKLQALFDRYYTSFIQPGLNQAGKDCSQDTSNIQEALIWARQAALLLGQGAYPNENAAITTAMVATSNNCWTVATTPCMNWNDPAQTTRVLSLAREAVLLGMDATKFDPYALPHCQCSQLAQVTHGWRATLSYSWNKALTTSDSYQTLQMRAAQSANVTVDFTQQQLANWDATSIGGNAVVDEREDYSSAGVQGWSTAAGSGTPSQQSVLPQGRGTFVGINANTCTFTMYLPVVQTIVSESGDSLGNHHGPSTAMVQVGLLIVHNTSIAWGPSQSDLTIRHSDVMAPGYGDCTYGDCFSLPQLDATADLVRILGKGMWGNVIVNWTLTPITP